MRRETPVDRWRCGGCDQEFRRIEDATKHHREVHPGWRIYYDPEWVVVIEEDR